MYFPLPPEAERLGDFQSLDQPMVPSPRKFADLTLNLGPAPRFIRVVVTEPCSCVLIPCNDLPDHDRCGPLDSSTNRPAGFSTTSLHVVL